MRGHGGAKWGERAKPVADDWAAAEAVMGLAMPGGRHASRISTRNLLPVRGAGEKGKIRVLLSWSLMLGLGRPWLITPWGG